jgi:hypothetical protein
MKTNNQPPADSVQRCPHRPDPGDGSACGPGFGWVYKFGTIQLITCKARACRPADPAWIQGVEFVAK